tara:strand:- start:2707 stop:3345 length:639 start_codon:yes stop_codon:yes gene_type:complete
MKPRFGLYVAYLQEDSEEQRDAIRTALRHGQAELVEEFVESDNKRFIGLKQACLVAHDIKGTVITPTFSTIEKSLTALTILIENRTRVIVVDEPEMSDAQYNKKHIKIMFNRAVKRRDNIKKGLRKAKQIGKKLGAPKGSSNLKLARKANIVKFKKFRQLVLPYIKECRDLGAKTRKEVAACLEAKKIRTASGKSRWYESSIRNIEIGEQND